MTNTWFVGRVGEERGLREGRSWALKCSVTRSTWPGGLHDGQKLPCIVERGRGIAQGFNELIHQGKATVGVALLTQCPQNDIAEMPSQDVRLIGLVDRGSASVYVVLEREFLLKRPSDQALVEPFEQAIVFHHARQLARHRRQIRQPDPLSTWSWATLVNPWFSLAALRQAAQRVRLDAAQGADGVWRSSRGAVDRDRKIKGQRRR